MTDEVKKKDWFTQLRNAKGEWAGFVKDEATARQIIADRGLVGWTFTYKSWASA